jgi:hypothetical protein
VPILVRAYFFGKFYLIKLTTWQEASHQVVMFLQVNIYTSVSHSNYGVTVQIAKAVTVRVAPPERDWDDDPVTVNELFV